MTLKFVFNFNMLEVVEANEMELEQLMLTCTGKNYNFRTRSNFEQCFFKNYQYMPAGFWMKILQLRTLGFEVEITNFHEFVRTDITKESLTDWMESQNLIYNPYDYQEDAFYKLIKYPRSKAEIGTGGGKTFTACLISRYYLQKILPQGKKILIIVPSRSLVTQFLKDMAKYCDDGFLIMDSIFSGGKRYAQSNLIVGTFQSLSNMDAEFFEDVGMVLCDEAHRAKSASIKDEIIPKINWRNCMSFHGMTGTEPDDNIGKLTLEAYIGPTLQFTPTSKLEEVGSIVPTKVHMIKFVHTYETALDYYFADETQTMDASRLLYEKELILSNPIRQKYIANIMIKLPRNALMLFHTKAYAYTFYEYLSHNCDKKIFIITGDHNDKYREAVFKEFDESTDAILCATSGTMSTGISIDNIFYLATADGGKAKIVVNQSIGRGVRLHSEKSKLHYLDFFDEIPRYDIPNIPKTAPESNILCRQAASRRKLYNDRKTEHATSEVMLSKYTTKQPQTV